MYRYSLLLALVLFNLACGPSANVEQERSNLTALDREWAQTTRDLDKFLSYYAPDASIYPQGMPIATGTESIRALLGQLSSMPGFGLTFSPTKAEVSAAGDVGYTSGTYELTMNDAAGKPSVEKGKYVAVWKKQADGSWKVMEDIFNADAVAQPAPATHVMTTAAAIQWGAPPPTLPAGAKLAVVSGDPASAGLFSLRLQMPAGYTIAPHTHPTDEHVTVLSGTLAVGMGEKFAKDGLTDVPAGGYTLLPAKMPHFAMAKTASTIQVHGMGPFVVNYVNPADDPSQQKPSGAR